MLTQQTVAEVIQATEMVLAEAEAEITRYNDRIVPVT